MVPPARPGRRRPRVPRSRRRRALLRRPRLQDYLNRDRLPAAGVDIPAFQTTTFQITSTVPSPVVDGTLSIDVNTRAFEFRTRPVEGLPQVHLVSPDGSRVLIEDGGAWRDVVASDPVVADVMGAIPFLVGVDTADDILINRMRNGYVDLLEQETEGVGDTALERYRISIDVGSYDADQPLQWRSFQQEVVPGIDDTGVTELTFWLDADDVLVRMLHPATNWSWERTSRSERPIQLPAAALAAAGWSRSDPLEHATVEQRRDAEQVDVGVHLVVVRAGRAVRRRRRARAAAVARRWWC